MVTTNVGSVFNRLPRQDYPMFIRGQGSRLFDSNGKMYIDASGGGAGVTCIGHGNAYVVDKICKQHSELSYVSNMLYTNQQQESLASRLADIAPGDLGRVYFAQDGTEANEAALRVARQYHIDRGEPKRNVIISQACGYYGSTFGAMALSGIPSARFPANEWLARFERVVPPQCGEGAAAISAEPCVPEEIGNFESIANRVGSDRIAAVITEIIVLTGGALNQPDAYLSKLADWCRRIGALLIIDEVVTGIGRTGRWFCSERANIIPDIVTLGKGLGGGYAPISAVIVSNRVYETIASTSGQFTHGHSLSGNPASCAASNAVLDVITDENLVERSRDVGNQIRNLLSREFATSELVQDIRGEGTFIALEFGYGGGRFLESDRRFANLLQLECFDNGLLVGSGGAHPAGVFGDHLVLWPAFNITETDIDEMVKRLKTAVLRASGAVIAPSTRPSKLIRN